MKFRPKRTQFQEEARTYRFGGVNREGLHLRRRGKPSSTLSAKPPMRCLPLPTLNSGESNCHLGIYEARIRKCLVVIMSSLSFLSPPSPATQAPFTLSYQPPPPTHTHWKILTIASEKKLSWILGSLHSLLSTFSPMEIVYLASNSSQQDFVAG